MHRISGIFAALLALAALPAFAEDAPKAHDPRAAFAETDGNADGRIDREEFHVRLVELFFHGDRDKERQRVGAVRGASRAPRGERIGEGDHGGGGIGHLNRGWCQ